jgi:hypothetical protein
LADAQQLLRNRLWAFTAATVSGSMPKLTRCPQRIAQAGADNDEEEGSGGGESCGCRDRLLTELLSQRCPASLVDYAPTLMGTTQRRPGGPSHMSDVLRTFSFGRGLRHLRLHGAAHMPR